MSEHPKPPDNYQLRPYMDELMKQRQMARLAARSLNAARERGAPPWELFAHIQSMLGTGAMISKLMWTSKNARARAKTRALAIREALGIAEMPVLQQREVRNSFEHIDDRLDDLTTNGESIVDSNVGPPGSIRIEGMSDDRFLRSYDPEALIVGFFGDRVHLQKLMDAIDLVADRAEQWLRQLTAWPTFDPGRPSDAHRWKLHVAVRRWGGSPLAAVRHLEQDVGVARMIERTPACKVMASESLTNLSNGDEFEVTTGPVALEQLVPVSGDGQGAGAPFALVPGRWLRVLELEDVAHGPRVAVDARATNHDCPNGLAPALGAA